MNMLRTLAHSLCGHNALRVNCRAPLYELLTAQKQKAYPKEEAAFGF